MFIYIYTNSSNAPRDKIVSSIEDDLLYTSMDRVHLAFDHILSHLHYIGAARAVVRSYIYIGRSICVYNYVETNNYSKITLYPVQPIQVYHSVM